MSADRSLSGRWFAGLLAVPLAGYVLLVALLVAGVFAEEVQAKLREYHDRAARRRADAQLENVSRAAAHGRVRDLFVAEDRHLWGHLDRETGEVSVHEAQLGAEDADLLDDLGEMVLRCGGDVWVLPPDLMPGGAAVAAIFRY